MRMIIEIQTVADELLDVDFGRALKWPEAARTSTWAFSAVTIAARAIFSRTAVFAATRAATSFAAGAATRPTSFATATGTWSTIRTWRTIGPLGSFLRLRLGSSLRSRVFGRPSLFERCGQLLGGRRSRYRFRNGRRGGLGLGLLFCNRCFGRRFAY
jgi:hypothetical protein